MGKDYESKPNEPLRDGNISQLAEAIVEALKNISKVPDKPLEGEAQMAADTFADIVGGLGIGRQRSKTTAS